MGWRAARLSRGWHKRRETWWDRGGCAATSYARRREEGRWWDGCIGPRVTGCQRLWWRSWRWRCWVNDREKHSTPGNADASATEGVVRRRRHTGRQRSTGKSGVWMWLTDRCRATIGLWLASQGRRLSRANDDDSVWVAVVGWHRHGVWVCCVGGAGRDLRHVGVRGGESVWGHAADVGLMLGAANTRVAVAQCNDTACPAQVGADGRGCRDGL
jgi:hypothetical protein